MTKYCVYVHPAVPKGNIKLGIWLEYDELLKYYTLEELKCFFHPCNFSWSEVETVESKNKQIK